MEARFIISAARPEQFPDGAAGRDVPEIAFLGRSNVGKSSLLNALVGREGLAFTSARPGCTQLINFYEAGGYRLADLPGYGYARVPQEIRKEWKGLIESYLKGRGALRLCVVLLDARRGWMEKDRELKAWLEHHRRRYLVVATKIDKLKRSEERGSMDAIRKEVGDDTELLAFSAVSGRGVREIWQAIKKTRNAQ